MKTTIRTIYLYVVSLIALVVILVNAGILLNMALQAWVFQDAGKADQYYEYPPYPASYVADPNMDLAKTLKDNPNLSDEQKRQIEQWLADYENYNKGTLSPEERRSAEQQRDASRALSMLIVAIPVFWLHWRLVRRDS